MKGSAEVADYIKSICSELSSMAGQAGLTQLQYLLGMCVLEAESKSAPPKSSPSKKGTKPLREV
jgi:hypothetical protein